MKKLSALILVWLLMLSGCGSQNTSSDAADAANAANAKETSSETTVENTQESNEVVEITENLFIAQTNEIYLNAVDYLGKTIKYEGIFNVYEWEETDTTYYQVIRYGPGCCGNDGVAGFEVIWDGDYPQQDDWVEVVGTLEEYEENGSQILRIRLTSLSVLEERGAEYVET